MIVYTLVNNNKNTLVIKYLDFYDTNFTIFALNVPLLKL